MINIVKKFMFVAALLGAAGCSTATTASNGPTSGGPAAPASTCSGVPITGTLVDSLTQAPVAQGTATAEAGAQFGPAIGSSTNPGVIDNFAPIQTTAVDN